MDSFMMSQIVSLPSKICNHKYLCSTDPRVCILPGQTGVHVFEDSPMDENDYENAPKYIGDDAENSKLEGLKLWRGTGLMRFLVNKGFKVNSQTPAL